MSTEMRTRLSTKCVLASDWLSARGLCSKSKSCPLRQGCFRFLGYLGFKGFNVRRPDTK